MTSFVFKSLLIAGAFAFFGGHVPLPAEAHMPRLTCTDDLGSCRLGDTVFAVGERSPLLAALARQSRGTPVEDFGAALKDPQLATLLDVQVVPDFALAAAQTRLADAAHHFIEGIETGAR